MPDPPADPATHPLRAALATPATATFQWPWDIAQRGGEYFSGHNGAVRSLTSAAAAILGSSEGPGIAAAVKGSPTSSQSTGKVLNNSLFGPALAAIKADQLLRTVFVGWASSAQVGLFGGGGGSGVAYDVLNPTDLASVSYGMFNLGIGGHIVGGLLVGAMTALPRQLNDSTAVFEFGATLGVGVFVSVIMTGSDLDLIGFSLTVGAGGGFSSSTGYGGISASK